MIELTSTGLAIDSLQENLDEVKAEFRAAISPTMNLEETSLMGQYLAVVMNQLQQVKEAAQHEYASMDPAQASGAALDRLVRLVGVERKGAQASVAMMTLTLAAATYPAGTLVVHVIGDATLRFYNEFDITSIGGVMTGQRFLSEELGQIRANAGTLTVIANPVVGFTAATNPLDAELGFEQETDAALRARWVQQLARPGSATVDAIRADVLQVADFVRVYENDTDFVDADGLPPHSFETLVLGGIDAEIAQAIFDTKPAGIQAYGETIVVVTDQQGAGHSIGFTRPDDVEIYLNMVIVYQAGLYAGDDAMRIALVDWGDTHLGPGNDVIYNRIVQLIMEQTGVIDVYLQIGDAAANVAPASFPIAVREIARLDTSRMVIFTYARTGAP